MPDQLLQDVLGAFARAYGPRPLGEPERRALEALVAKMAVLYRGRGTSHAICCEDDDGA